METRFLDHKTKRFHFHNGVEDTSYVGIFGDEFQVDPAEDNSGASTRSAEYRGRTGTIPTNTRFVPTRSLEMYFLDIGQGDAAFMVTPNNTKILVDGGLKDRALGFLIWKYRLDIPTNSVTIDHLFLSHADKDHVQGLVPLLNHPRITVNNIYHNGIALFESGHNEDLGTVQNDRLITLHSSVNNLTGANLKDGFGTWIQVVRDSGANYRRLDASDGFLDIGDNDIQLEILGPILETDGSLKWFHNKSHTINGHSLVFRLDYRHVRAFFSGDLNIEGSKNLLMVPGNELRVNSHIFKAPHHGSHEFSMDLFRAVNPMITVISSGETPDHGHPRAVFMGGVGLVGRGTEPLIFSTELSALFVDDNDPESVAHAANVNTTLEDLDLSIAGANTEARQRFKKILPGIINIRTNGERIYSFRRLQMGYQWESYDQRFVNS